MTWDDVKHKAERAVSKTLTLEIVSARLSERLRFVIERSIFGASFPVAGLMDFSSDASDTKSDLISGTVDIDSTQDYPGELFPANFPDLFGMIKRTATAST